MSSEATTTRTISDVRERESTVALEVLLDVHQRVEDDVGEGAIVEVGEIGGGVGERLVDELVDEGENDGEEVLRVQMLVGGLVELHLGENHDDVRDESEVVGGHRGQQIVGQLLHLLDHIGED